MRVTHDAEGLENRIRKLVNSARRVLSANQEAQPYEHHLAMEELKRAVENSEKGME